jgi:hypothetical protein
MEDALLRLAKERMPDFVTEHEGQRDSRVEEKLVEWEQGVQADIVEAEETLARPNLGHQAHTAWQQKLDRQRAELERKEARKTGFEKVVDNEIENEIKEEAKKHYADVLDTAAAEVGFTVAEHGPYPRDLQQRPRFKQRFDPTVGYLWSTQSTLDEGEATAVLQDIAERRMHVAVCTAVEPVTAEDITRLEFERYKQGGVPFARLQMFQSLLHVFSREALDARYEFERADVGSVVEPMPPADK